jgi:large subunit ribosomal protein L21
MSAVIKTGGKQYRVSEGDVLKIEKLGIDEGEEVTFDQVLMISDGENITVGAPVIENAKVIAQVIENGRHKKIKILKFKRRKHQMRRTGHRQSYTEVKITSISS